MSVIIIVLICIGILFALAFFTKRRFGMLGLALGAGSIISGLWTEQLTPYVSQAGIQIVAPPLSSIVATVLILAPAIILLFTGRKYSKLPQRVIGAAAFALLAVAFMLQPLGSALLLDGQGKQVFDVLNDNRSYIITAGLLFAVLDIMMIKKPKPEKTKH